MDLVTFTEEILNGKLHFFAVSEPFLIELNLLGWIRIYILTS